MKKIVFLLVCLFSMTIVKADNDKPIEMNQLPAKAQTFITTYFKDQKVALITQETGLFTRVMMWCLQAGKSWNSINREIGQR